MSYDAGGRPRYLVAVVGTQTEVGKTWFAAQLLLLARRHGVSVAARKPAQSFAEANEGERSDATDADRLAAASGESPLAVCPAHRSYPVAMAPPMAADVLQRPKIYLRDLCAEISWPSKVELGVVETAGGVCSPIAHDGDNLELLALIEPDDIVLIADAGLGTINAVRSSLCALGDRCPTTVFLNRFRESDDLHRRNREWLQAQYGIQPLVGIEAVWQRIRESMR